jgi:hypothetical protein
MMVASPYDSKNKCKHDDKLWPCHCNCFCISNCLRDLLALAIAHVHHVLRYYKDIILL